MEFYGSIDIYASSTAQVAARMEFLPSQHFVDAVNGAKARFCVRFTAYQSIEQPRFKLIAGSAAVGLLPAEHTVIPVGEGSPFFVEIPITDEARFSTFPRVTRLKIAVDTADSAFVTVSPSECGVDALKWRLAPVLAVNRVRRCDLSGHIRPDGVRGRVEGMTLTPQEEWAGDPSELLIRRAVVESPDGTSYSAVMTDAMLSDALDGGYSETIPALLSGMTLSASSVWTVTFTTGFTEDNVSTAVVTVGEAFANLHLSGASTGGACFGGFSRSTEGSPMLESRYPAYLYSGVCGLSHFPEGVQRVGTWYDGRVVYAQWFRKSGISGTGAAASVVLGTVNCDFVIHSIGGLKRSDGRKGTLPWVPDASHYACVDFSANGEIRFRHLVSSSYKYEVFVCVWYVTAADVGKGADL